MAKIVRMEERNFGDCQDRNSIGLLLRKEGKVLTAMTCGNLGIVVFQDNLSITQGEFYGKCVHFTPQYFKIRIH